MEQTFLHGRSQSVLRVLILSVSVVAAAVQPLRSSGEESGSLAVDSNPPGAVVYVDGRFAGQTPLTLATIAPGEHRVQLARAGYLENSRLVTIKPGGRATVRTQLTAAAPPLKIVVVEGEGAVNIIQQKTAVAPVIEVRDRNDQPVSGALVRFAIQKGKATFNGVRALTATTDALGRATATGLAPTGSGPVSIAASATSIGVGRSRHRGDRNGRGRSRLPAGRRSCRGTVDDRARCADEGARSRGGGPASRRHFTSTGRPPPADPRGLPRRRFAPRVCATDALTAGVVRS